MPSVDPPSPATAGKRGRRGRGGARPTPTRPAVWPGMAGGALRPLSDHDVAQVHAAVLDILETVGMGDAPDFVARRIVDAGGILTDTGRLLFPRALVEDAIDRIRRDIVLHGQRPGHELELTAGRVHVGSGGAAPSVVDLETGAYRPSTLQDLYDAARLCDALHNVHFFSRSLVARDMPDEETLDVNTAYACLAGTTKHVAVAAARRGHVERIADMAETVAGGGARFDDAPFLSLNVNHVVPPLRFIPENVAVIEQAARRGLPIFVNSFDQAGASSPASLAGSLAQSIAETLAGMIFAWLVNPDCRAIFGPRPLITDLRTGGLTGGSGEQAAAMAGAAQMAAFYDLPNSCIAGATDSKVPDAQSGYEKSLTVSLAAHAGSNIITQACGMHAALMGVAFESYVIDDDMLGGILRSVRGLEVNAESLARDVIDAVANGPGHFLGEADTLARMETDYLYPAIADRRAPEEWEADGSPALRDRAKARAREILNTHFPDHLAPYDDALRGAFDIRLPKTAMRPPL